MGEIADSIIDGEFCACGEYLGEAVGFPQFCSPQCQKDYGGGFEKLPKSTLLTPPTPGSKRQLRKRRRQDALGATMGRPSCPFCQRFPKTQAGLVAHVREKHPEQITGGWTPAAVSP